MRWGAILLLFLGAAGCTAASAGEPRGGSMVQPATVVGKPGGGASGASGVVHDARCRVSYRRDIDQCRGRYGEAREDCMNVAYVDLGRCLDRL
jgi:hypothetical protein